MRGRAARSTSAPPQPVGSLSAAQSTPWQANLGSLDAGGNYGGSDDSSDQKHQLHPDRPSADLPHAFTVASEGANTVEFFSRDFVGNVEQTQSTSFKIDVTPPTVVCAVSPGSLAPPSHKLVPVAASVNVADAGSGPAGFTLTGVDSSEPDDGLGDGDTPNDIQGFTLGTPDTTGQLRAERAGDGSGRI